MRVKEGYLYVLVTADWRVVKAGFTTNAAQRFQALSYKVWRQFKAHLVAGYRRPAKETDEFALLAHLVDFRGLLRLQGLEWYKCEGDVWYRLQKWLIRNGWEAIILPPAHRRIHFQNAAVSTAPPKATAVRDTRAATVLDVMAQHKEPISAHTLALRLNVADRTAQQYLSRLILKGLVRVTMSHPGTRQQLKLYGCVRQTNA